MQAEVAEGQQGYALSNEAQTILWALDAKPHLAGLVDAFKKQMGLFETHGGRECP